MTGAARPAGHSPLLRDLLAAEYLRHRARRHEICAMAAQVDLLAPLLPQLAAQGVSTAAWPHALRWERCRHALHLPATGSLGAHKRLYAALWSLGFAEVERRELSRSWDAVVLERATPGPGGARQVLRLAFAVDATGEFAVPAPAAPDTPIPHPTTA